MVLLFFAKLNHDAHLRQARDKLAWDVTRLDGEMNRQAMFVRMLTHEVRTPLAIIDSHSQLLALKAQGGVPAEVMPIRAAVSRLSELMERCLAQDRHASIGSLRKAPMGLADILANVAQEAQARSYDHLITRRIDNLPAGFSGDAALLRIMLANLLDNAIKYSPEGGCVDIAAHRNGPAEVVIEVSDEGVGIPEGALGHIFERYCRTHQVEDAVGAGLGLYIVRNIARLHDGDVSCESRLGEGSTFRVVLPV